MSNAKYSLENVRSGLTLSGLDPQQMPMDTMIECYSPIFVDVLAQDLPKAEALLREMQEFECVGNFIAKPETQLFEFAVFGLILIDRFVDNACQKRDGWESVPIWEQICECQEYILHPSERVVRQNLARRAANARHQENYEMKKQVIEYYTAHMSEFKSTDAAAAAIAGKLVPLTFRTVRDWIASYRKQLQSAGTPLA